ncbi:MAG: monovalent cation/H(+) antiporter subunit G [Phycisphaerales bacterium]|nr:monovalent cation/H(+) antiporter subunit G [Phycisphaerales bacterium]
MIWQTIGDALSIFCALAGIFFMFVGAIGVVRLPDAYNRLHATSKCSTLGIMGLALAAVFHVGTLAVTTKALMTIVFAFVAAPVGSHMLAKAAHIDGMKPWDRQLSDELQQDKDRQSGKSLSNAPRDLRLGPQNKKSGGPSGADLTPRISAAV